MRTSTIFREVKRRLPTVDDAYSGESPYICDHVSSICDARGMHTKSDKITGMINSRLGRKFSVRQWLIHTQGIDRNDINETNIQEYRQRWLDSLIAEFKAKGD